MNWWADDADERYWMESTDRPDIGGDLRNYAETDAGRRIAPAELLREMAVDDIVFHYDKKANPGALVGYSRVVSEAATEDQLDGRRWLEREIAEYTPISPVTLDEIRVAASSLLELFDAIKDRGKPPYFLPIIRGPGGVAQPPNAYVSKVPRAMVDALRLLDPDRQTSPPLGVPLTGPRPRPKRPIASDPFPTDPDKIDRGSQAHYDIEEALRAFVDARGAQTLYPAADEPVFDLAWTIAGRAWLAEIKSTTETNEERQLRYGLGQLLRYAQEFAAIAVNLVLVVEAPVRDARWLEICSSVGVSLTWPQAFNETLVGS